MDLPGLLPMREMRLSKLQLVMDGLVLAANLDSRQLNADWRIDGVLSRPGQATRGWLFVYCSLVGGTKCKTHIAKLLSNEANDRDMRYFERQAHLATRLNCLAASWLDSPTPALIFPCLSGAHLDEWLAGQTQLVSRLTWVPIARILLQQLVSLHRLGYAHTNLRPEHVWLDSLSHIHLIGLGRSEPIGEAAEARITIDEFDAPECTRNSEVSSAQDIYSAAAIFDKLASGTFLQTPVGRCMQAHRPCDRPTASELVELFMSYERELFASCSFAAA